MKNKFAQATYVDARTGDSLPYNVYLPEGYDTSKTYPLVLYIADSSLVGQEVTAPLSQYGALIWASEYQQGKQKSIVVVPEYPETILDDHGSFTTTEYVEMTARFVAAMKKKYSVDPSRVYGTGQSMGCMTVMYLAAKYPTLFTAELFVSGQWDASVLGKLADQKFVYFAAGGDANSTGGQADVEKILKKAGVKYGTATLDATASRTKQESTMSTLIADGDTANFATFKTGSVLKVSGSSSTSAMGSGGQPGGSTAPPMGGSTSGPSMPAGSTSAPSMPAGGASGSTSASSMGSSSEHLASFQPAYKIAATRDWLFQQVAS